MTEATYLLNWMPNWPGGHAAAALNSTIVPDPRAMEEIARMIAGMEPPGMPGCGPERWEEILAGEDAVRWPDHEAQMAAVSRRWPDTLFELHRETRDGGFMMDCYLDGRVQTLEAEVSFGPLRPDGWREPEAVMAVTPPQGGCGWIPCGQDPSIRILYPAPEDVWMRLADYCGFHFGVMVSEGRITRNWRVQALDNLPEGELRAGQTE